MGMKLIAMKSEELLRKLPEIVYVDRFEEQLLHSVVTFVVIAIFLSLSLTPDLILRSA